MHSTSIAWLAAAAFLYVSGTFLARRLRDWHAAEWLHLTRDSLEETSTGRFDALHPQTMRAIRDEAEAAALAMASGGKHAARNRHEPRTRAHILWETSFHARLIYLTERRPARGAGLAVSIDRIRAQGPARPAAPR